MSIGYVVTLRNDRLDRIPLAIGASGLLRIFMGTKPAVGGAETTLLASLPLSATAAPASAAGVLTFNPITTVTAVATGTPTWARLATSASAPIVDFTASVGGGGGDLDFDLGFILNANVAVSSLTITDGSS